MSKRSLSNRVRRLEIKDGDGFPEVVLTCIYGRVTYEGKEMTLDEYKELRPTWEDDTLIIHINSSEDEIDKDDD